jgi:hypothetical protein
MFSNFVGRAAIRSGSNSFNSIPYILRVEGEDFTADTLPSIVSHISLSLASYSSAHWMSSPATHRLSQRQPQACQGKIPRKPLFREKLLISGKSAQDGSVNVTERCLVVDVSSLVFNVLQRQYV